MKSRRKSGLSKDDIEALKELPRVLKALENLQEQHAKVRALMGQPVDSIDPATRGALIDLARRSALKEVEGMTFASAREANAATRLAVELGVAPARNPTLDTPERREHEEAKRAGRTVPVADPFANASPAQRERMAEQRATTGADRAARGLPTRTAPLLPTIMQPPMPSDPDAQEVVRTETLDTVSDGTTPLASDADDDPEVH